MKTYSVWRHGLRRYDYYQTPEVDHATASGRPAHLRQTNRLGVPPSKAAWPLPANAKLVGHGEQAIGHVAEHPSVAMGDVPMGSSGLMALGILSAIGWLLLR